MATSYPILPGNKIDLAPVFFPGGQPLPDATAALQAVIDSPQSKYAELLFPPNSPPISAMVDITSPARLAADPKNNGLILTGPDCNGSVLYGRFSGPLMGRNLNLTTGQGKVVIKGVGFQNTHSAGVGLQLEALLNGGLYQCRSTARRPFIIGELNTNTVAGVEAFTIEGCEAQGMWGTIPDAVGFSVNGSIHMRGIVAKNCGTAGIQASGVIGLHGYTSRVNGIALSLGLNPAGAGWPTDFFGSRLEIEACLQGIVQGKDTVKAVITGGMVTGDQVNAGNQHLTPINGVEHQAGAGVLCLYGVNVNGSFTDCAGDFDGNGPLIIDNGEFINSGKLPGSTLLDYIRNPATQFQGRFTNVA